MDYLLKTEASVYSFEDLKRDGVTAWDGVTNPAAVKHLREMQPGARLLIYETGERKSAVGTAADPWTLPIRKTPVVNIKAGKALASPFRSRRSSWLFVDFAAGAAGFGGAGTAAQYSLPARERSFDCRDAGLQLDATQPSVAPFSFPTI